MAPAKKGRTKKVTASEIPRVVYPPNSPATPTDADATPPRKKARAGPVKSKTVHENLKQPLPSSAFEKKSPKTAARSSKTRGNKVKSSTDQSSEEASSSDSSGEEDESMDEHAADAENIEDDESVEDGFRPTGNVRKTYPKEMFKIRSSKSFIDNFPGTFYSSKEFQDFLHVRSKNTLKRKMRKSLTSFINTSMKGLQNYPPEEFAKRRAHKNYILGNIHWALKNIGMKNVCFSALSDIAEKAIYKFSKNAQSNAVHNAKHNAKRKRSSSETSSSSQVHIDQQEKPLSDNELPGTDKSTAV